MGPADGSFSSFFQLYQPPAAAAAPIRLPTECKQQQQQQQPPHSVTDDRQRPRSGGCAWTEKVSGTVSAVESMSGLRSANPAAETVPDTFSASHALCGP